MNNLRREALAILLERDSDRKADRARNLPFDALIGDDDLVDPGGIPGRPDVPALVPHTQLKPRSVRTIEGRATLVHALAHIELNAIDLALDAVWRYPGLPADFYRDWA